MANFDIALDLGSQYITVACAKTGLVIKEPSVVAVDAVDNKTIKAAGLTAVKMSASQLAKVKLCRPIVEGAVEDKDKARFLLKTLISKVLPDSSPFSRAAVLCVVPCALTKNEKQKIEFVLNIVNVKQTRFVTAPIASSVEIFKQFHVDRGIICDMGADKTDIAVVVENEIISGCSIYFSGRQIDEDIVNFVHKKYNLQITTDEAERIKRDCASLYPNDISSVESSGINILKGVLETVEITARELYDVVANVISKYCQVIDSLLTAVPPEIAKTVKNEGVFLCGGLSKINGIDKYFLDGLKMNVRIPSDSDNLNAIGALKLI
ncbi:MAG TPA: rod shape-determining protein [Eubacteriales bacterium]|nr:rod shape-determining protein [Eubacteriales bacterium]